jgi:hypothetical protein
MRIRAICEEKREFSYHTLAKEMWREKIRDAQKKFNITFDTENDDSIGGSKEVKIGETKFLCEPYAAAGDWETPIQYYRVEIRDGYLDGRSEYNNPHFVFIPGPPGNPHLVKHDKTYHSPDSGTTKEKYNESECWRLLKAHLQELVDASNSSDQ